jgi:Flp pilus assembly pilin Flp
MTTRTRWPQPTEEGVTAIEYALIAALVFLVLLVAATALGQVASDMYRFVADVVGGAMASSG